MAAAYIKPGRLPAQVRAVFWVDRCSVISGRLLWTRKLPGGVLYRVCADDDGRQLDLYEEDAFFDVEIAHKAALAELVGA